MWQRRWHRSLHKQMHSRHSITQYPICVTDSRCKWDQRHVYHQGRSKQWDQDYPQNISCRIHSLILLCMCSIGLIMWSQGFYLEFSHVQLLKPYRWFCWCRKIFICFVISSICNQLTSAFGCRPIEILHDIRYISMFIVHFRRATALYCE